jgi:hypothetical protein
MPRGAVPLASGPWPLLTPFLASLLFLMGCGALKPDRLAALKDPEQAAEVTFMRPGAFLYGANAANVTIDGWIAGHVFNHQYLTVPLDPGLHSVGLTSSTVTLNFEPGQKIYFLIVVFPHSMAMRRIDEAQARQRMSGCRKIAVQRAAYAESPEAAPGSHGAGQHSTMDPPATPSR